MEKEVKKNASTSNFLGPETNQNARSLPPPQFKLASGGMESEESEMEEPTQLKEAGGFMGAAGEDTAQRKTAVGGVVQRQAPQTALERIREALDRWNVPEEEVITICGQLDVTEKRTVLNDPWYRTKMVSAFNVNEMTRAVNNLGAPLATKLDWIQAASFVTSAINYSEIKALITSASQIERDGLKTARWQGFFVSVCTNATMVEALNDLHFDLQTKLTWLEAELTSTRVELSYATIKAWVVAAPQTERDALKTTRWQSFFVSVCTNATMVEALNDLRFDLATKLTWLNAEMTSTRLELSYSTIKPWILAAAQPERDGLKSAAWRDFFVLVCNNTTMVEAIIDLDFDLNTKLQWLVAEGIGGSAFQAVVAQGGDFFTALEAADDAALAGIRADSTVINALYRFFTAPEMARLASDLILIAPATCVDRVGARNAAWAMLRVQLANKDIAKTTINGNLTPVIIPRNLLMTDLTQFSALAGTLTFDGRPWEPTRGVGYGRYVAMAEENLLGGACTATFNGNPVSGSYATGYSTASHEFAHGLHDNVLTSADQTTITTAYNARKALATAAPNDTDQWVDGKEGCYASQTDHEFFAQLSNAYLGTNTGTDPNTGDARHNGKPWVQSHEPTIYTLLDRMYAGGSIANANPAVAP